MKNRVSLIFIVVSLICTGPLPKVDAVSPPPDGGYGPPIYGVGNTAEGQNALLNLTNGTYNTAVGLNALRNTTDGGINTAIGVNALLNNRSGYNTATGFNALVNNIDGFSNTADGINALANNISGFFNTAEGYAALVNNTNGIFNTAVGGNALYSDTTGSRNTAVGWDAGHAATNGDGNVYIGAGMVGVAGESNACYIASIFGQTAVSGVPVLINSNNKLGTATSSKRFKDDIKPMDKASEVLLALKPITFRYKKEIDPSGASQFGLLAEDVAKVNPDLVVRDKEGKPYTVRYEQVNAMLLNEFLKEHRKNEEERATIAQLQSKMEALISTVKEQAAQIQKVNAQLEASKPASQVVNNL